MQHTFATFKGNRWPFHPAGRVTNSVRIAIIGDSMAFGAGVPYLDTFGPRLARHLNVARPGLWFDCQTFGIPGACAFHAMARAESHASPIEPDIVIFALTQNDARMLRGQPPTAEETGQNWLDFAPLLHSAFVDFAHRWRTGGRTRHIAVVYLDARERLGEVRPADILQPICRAADLSFIDGPAALTGTPLGELIVSSFDNHINGVAQDRIARHAARQLLTLGWIAAAADYDSGEWLDAFDAAADSLQAAGVPGPIAASQALNTLRVKWLDRRNRSRTAHEARYRQSERRLLERVQDQWTTAAVTSLTRQGLLTEVGTRVANVDDHLFFAGTLNFALRHAVSAGELGQPLDGLVRAAHDGEVSAGAVRALADRARHRADECAHFLRLPSLSPQYGLSRTAAQARLANQAAHHGLVELERLVPQLPGDCDTSAVARSAIAEWHKVDTTLDAVARELNWRKLANGLETFTPDRPTMTMRLSVLAGVGAETWAYRVGAVSEVHAVNDDYLACGYLERTGRMQVYQFDLPVMVEATIQLTINGTGIGPGLAGGELKVQPLRIDVPGWESPVECPMCSARQIGDAEWRIEFQCSFFPRPL